jgi:3-deoxy-manno-octulosonate cytidylyltransferase (CMP-KDO synthetase)
MGGGVAVVIPARLGATRFPRKLLARAAGRTILEWTWMRARDTAGLRGVWIATDSGEIEAEARAFGAQVIPTGDHRSGTDRVAAAAGAIDPAPEWIVNVQGDEPLIAPATIGAVAVALRETPGTLVTCSAPLGDHRAWVDPAVVKVVTDERGYALYFSRAPIPATKGGASAEAFAHIRGVARAHVGIYGYPLDLLRQLCALPSSALEQAESLEQLRALEAGLRIRVIPVGERSQAVDTPADLERVRPWLAAEVHRTAGDATSTDTRTAPAGPTGRVRQGGSS